MASAYLEEEVEGNPGEEDVSEVLHKPKGSVHHPVSQPLCVIVLLHRVNGLAPEQGGSREGSRGGRAQHVLNTVVPGEVFSLDSSAQGIAQLKDHRFIKRTNVTPPFPLPLHHQELTICMQDRQSQRD